MTIDRRMHLATALVLVALTTARDPAPPVPAGTPDADPGPPVANPFAESSARAGSFGDDTPSDPVAFVKAMYADDGLNAAVSTVGDLRDRYLTDELAGLLADTTQGDGTTLTADPLCLCSNPRDLQPAIVLRHADAKQAVVRVTVARHDANGAGIAHLLIVLKRDLEGWKVAEIHYPDEKLSLRQMLAKANGDTLYDRAPN